MKDFQKFNLIHENAMFGWLGIFVEINTFIKTFFTQVLEDSKVIRI